MFACQEVKGYLDNGISPMLKHFGPHGNPSGGLNLASVNCGIGELHDIYLQPFRKVITASCNPVFSLKAFIFLV